MKLLLKKTTMEEEKVENRLVSYGEKAVGLSFNPSGDPTVNAIKKHYAEIVDEINILRNGTEDPEVKRLCSIAITEAQTAQMWAVKAITWK